MFDTLKLYIHKEISPHQVIKKLVDLGYKSQSEVLNEGDFAFRGEVLEIFPVNFNFPLRIEWCFEKIECIYSFDKLLGKKIFNYNFIIIIPFFSKIKKKEFDETLPLEGILEIQPGDYVVHINYGIGRFLGIKKLKIKDKFINFFEIEYLNKDKIYVSLEEAHLIQKYINFTSRSPKLNKLGTREWQRTKERVLSGIRKYALEILTIEAQRKLIGGFKFAVDGEWQKIFEESFPYQETQDQKKATFEVKQDMESSRCMDRIICGDTGYGKTEVAMRAAVKAVSSFKQVAFLVPTTILAYQHYLNFKKRLNKLPIKVTMLSRFCSKKEKEEIIKDLREGKIDIVVGTHSLLSENIVFKDLGLLIVDEEQRFGVEHKEKIKRLKIGVDVLTLTATPIPRTLYMSLVGLKDISIIKTPPAERLAVKTEVVEFSSSFLREIILKEIRRKGEVFFIHNRIETIEKIYKLLEEILPKEEVKIGIVHAKLPAKEIEKVMFSFIEKKINLLLSTAIVESGIDIPSANTIIVNNAHTFGLADLHQLRGRVGRANREAYAYFVIPNWEVISDEAKERLKMLKEFSHLGAGFEIAMRDLELRGAGNILGKEQHGFIWMVGFDLYCRLLKKEIEYLRHSFNLK